MRTNLAENYIGDRPGHGRCVGNYCHKNGKWVRINHLSLINYQLSQNCIRGSTGRNVYKDKKINMSCIGRIV